MDNKQSCPTCHLLLQFLEFTIIGIALLQRQQLVVGGLEFLLVDDTVTIDALGAE